MITEEAILDIAREAIYTIIICAAPLLLTSLVIGLIVSIFQTVTSIQEQTLTFVPKLLGVFAMLMLCGSWLMNNLSGFMEELWSNFSYYISLGI
jgi:flagellar biosynthetic protein FliQ